MIELVDFGITLRDKIQVLHIDQLACTFYTDVKEYSWEGNVSGHRHLANTAIESARRAGEYPFHYRAGLSPSNQELPTPAKSPFPTTDQGRGEHHTILKQREAQGKQAHQLSITRGKQALAELHRRNNAATTIQLWQRRVLIMSYLHNLTEKRLQYRSLCRNASTDTKLVKSTQQPKLPVPPSTAPPASPTQTIHTVPNLWPRGLPLEPLYAMRQQEMASIQEGAPTTSTSPGTLHPMHPFTPSGSGFRCMECSLSHFQ